MRLIRMARKKLPKVFKPLPPFNPIIPQNNFYLSFISNELMYRQGLDIYAVAVFANIAGRYKREKIKRWKENLIYLMQRPQQEIADDLDISLRKVRDSIKLLESKGLLHVVPQMTASYYVPLDPVDEDYPRMLECVNRHRTGGDWQEINYFLPRKRNKKQKPNPVEKVINSEVKGATKEVKDPITITQFTMPLAAELLSDYKDVEVFFYSPEKGYLMLSDNFRDCMPEADIKAFEKEHKIVMCTIDEGNRDFENE